jgi:hypothetical protein
MRFVEARLRRDLFPGFVWDAVEKCSPFQNRAFAGQAVDKTPRKRSGLTARQVKGRRSSHRSLRPDNPKRSRPEPRLRVITTCGKRWAARARPAKLLTDANSIFAVRANAANAKRQPTSSRVALAADFRPAEAPASGPKHTPFQGKDGPTSGPGSLWLRGTWVGIATAMTTIERIAPLPTKSRAAAEKTS